MKIIKTLSALFLLTFLGNAFAVDKEDWKLSIGTAVMLKNNLRLNNSYSHMDRSLTYRFIPFFEGRYNRVTLGQNGLSFRAIGDFAIHTNIFINYMGDKYHSESMDKRRSSAFMGLNFKYHGSQLTIARDVESRSNGMEYKYSFSKFHFINQKWVFIHTYALSYHDNKYANYYYGIRNNEITQNRSAFTAKGYFTPSIAFLPVYKFNEHITGTIGTFFKYIPQRITSSPTMKGTQLEISTLWGFSYNL